MGWKTAILMACDGDPAQCLRNPGTLAPAATADLVNQAYPRWTATPTEGKCLEDAVYPPRGIAYAGSFTAADIVCDQELMRDYPSRLPQHLVGLSAGRTLVLHTMHSVVDFFAYAIWVDGTLVRSLSMALGGPRPGILENIGTPQPFEQPYWAGKHAIGDGYPLPFYPLDLAEPPAMRALFGFSLGQPPRPGDTDATGIQLDGFAVPASEPIAPELTRTRRRPTYRLVNGKLVQVEE
jgi:hypothetical protein